MIPVPSVLFTGGCRSGKSGLAQHFIESHAPPFLFLATAQALDEEMAARIFRHQADRGPGWRCLEAPLDLPGALENALTRPGHNAILLDCVTVWLGNLVAAGRNADFILREAGRIALLLDRPKLPVAVVTNEVGSGIVPASAMGREFRDLAGGVNQLLARACSHVVFAVCGLPLPVKPPGGPLP